MMFRIFCICVVGLCNSCSTVNTSAIKNKYFIRNVSNNDGFYEAAKNDNGVKTSLYTDSNQIYLINKTPSITASYFEPIYLIDEPSLPENEVLFVIYFSPEGADKFAEITDSNIGERIFLVIDGKIISNPIVNARIDGGSFGTVINKEQFNKLFTNEGNLFDRYLINE